MPERHLIQKQKFEIAIDGQDDAPVIQEKVSAIFHQKIIHRIDKVFTDFLSEKDKLVVPQLVLNLGEVSLSDLENALIHAVEKKLPLILAELINEKKSNLNQHKSQLELLEFYLKTGQLPWWGGARQHFSFDELLRNSLKKKPKKTEQLLLKLLSDSQIRKRFLFQSNNDTLQIAKKNIIGNSYSKYNWYLQQILRLHQYTKLRELTNQSFSHYSENLLLTYLTEESKPAQSPQKFGLYFLDRIVQDFKVTEEGIQSYYKTKIPRKSASQSELIWLNALDDWQSKRENKSSYSELELVVYYLKMGHIPSNQNILTTLADIEAAILDWSKNASAAWRKTLIGLLTIPEIVKRINYQLHPQTVEAIHRMLYDEKHFRLTRYIWSEVSVLTQLSSYLRFLSKSLKPFFATALTTYFLQYNKQKNFKRSFLNFFRNYLKQEENIDFINWQFSLSPNDKRLIKKSTILSFLFFPNATENYFFSGGFSAKILFQNPNLIEKLGLEKFKIDLGKKTIYSKETQQHQQVRQHFINILRSSDFYTSVAPALNVVELASIAELVFDREIQNYAITVEMLTEFLEENPLPSSPAKNSIPTIGLLWLSFLKSASQKNYHGFRGQKFWQNWMLALSELLQISVQKLWFHFQNIPDKFSEFLPESEVEQVVQEVQIFNVETQVEPRTTHIDESKILENYLQSGIIPSQKTLTQLDKWIKELLINEKEKHEHIILKALLNFGSLTNFNQLSIQTIEVIQDYFFASKKQILTLYFADFQVIIPLSNSFTNLPKDAWQREVRIGLLHAILTANTKSPEAEFFAQTVFRVFAEFHQITITSLELDFARVVQQNRLKLSIELEKYFQSIPLPHKNYSALQTLFYFLKTGTLPTGGVFSNFKELESWLIDEGIKEEEYIRTKLVEVSKQKNQFTRLIQQFSLESIQSINKILAGAHFELFKKTIAEFLVFFEKQDYPEVIKAQLDTILQKGLLQFLLENPNPPYIPNQLFQILLRKIGEHFKENISAEFASVKSLSDLQNSLSEQFNLSEKLSEKKTEYLQEEIEEDFFLLLTHQKIPKRSARLFPKIENLLLRISQSPSVNFLRQIKPQINQRTEANLTFIEHTFSLISIRILNRLIHPAWVQQEEQTLHDFSTFLGAATSISLSTNEIEHLVEIAVLEVFLKQQSPHCSLVFTNVFHKIIKQKRVFFTQFERELESWRDNSIPATVSQQKIKSWYAQFSKNQKIPTQEAKEHTQQVEKQDGALDLVINYLKTGKLSRNSPSASLEQLEHTLLQLLKEKPVEVCYEFENSLYNVPKLYERLEDSFSLHTLARLVETFGKAKGENLDKAINLWNKVNLNTTSRTKNIRKLTLKQITIIALKSILSPAKKESYSVIFLQKVIETLAEATQENLLTLTQRVLESWQQQNLNSTEEKWRNKIENWYFTKILTSTESKLEQFFLEQEQGTRSEIPTERYKTDATSHPANTIQKELENIFLYLKSARFADRQVLSSEEQLRQLFHKHFKQNPKLLKKTLEHLTPYQEAVLRILSIFSKKTITKIFNLLYSTKSESLLKYWNDLSVLLPGVLTKFNYRVLNDIFWYQILIFYPKARFTNNTNEQFFAQFIQHIAQRDRTNVLAVLHKIKENTEKERTRLRGNWDKLIPAVYQLLKDKMQEGQQKIKWDLADTEDLEDTAFYINNAGLVVIAPFFPRYFDMLGLLENGEFINTDAAERAVHLLQYIATGQTETEEAFLVFNKILCGVPLQTPIPKSIELTEKEEQVTDEMLQAILAHWKGLGTTTLEGLRGGFLLRNGKLEMHSDGYWNLDVEKKAYDILMQSLPWSISIIQPSWMKKRIQVTWN